MSSYIKLLENELGQILDLISRSDIGSINCVRKETTVKHQYYTSPIDYDNILGFKEKVRVFSYFRVKI